MSSNIVIISQLIDNTIQTKYEIATLSKLIKEEEGFAFMINNDSFAYISVDIELSVRGGISFFYFLQLYLNGYYFC